MTADRWKSFIRLSVEDDAAGDARGLDAIAAYLAEADQAKQTLHDKGYGEPATPLLRTVRQLPRVAA